MPEKRTIKKAQADKRKGKSASTQAGEFVHAEIHRIHQGKHGAKNAKQAIAIGLSEARRSGVEIPEKGEAKKSAAPSHRGRIAKHKVTATRSAAAKKRLQKEPKRSVSHAALSRQAKTAAHKRTHAQRSASAKKAAHTRSEQAKAA